MLQLQLPSAPGAPMKVLCGAAFSIWWMMCGSVATMIVCGGRRQSVVEDRLGRADQIGMVDDVRRAFGMGEHRGAGMLRLELEQLGLREGLVDDAHARPEQHVAAGLAGEIAAEMLVGAEDDLLLLRDLREDDLGRRAGDDDVAERLHRRRAVDVGQRDMVGMGLAEGLELVGRAAVLEAAAGVQVGQDDDLLGREDLGRLGHEAHPAEGDHVGVGRGGLARQVEAVADEIGEVLDLAAPDSNGRG